MQNLPPELLEHICIYLPRSTELRSTCRYLSQVIKPVNHWYYFLKHRYRLNLVIDGDIDEYNSIFGTNYQKWYDVYLRFLSMDTSSNDVIVYLASKSMIYLRNNIDSNKRLYILRYTNSHAVVRRYIRTLSIHDVLSILRCNLLKEDTSIRLLLVLMQHIDKREPLRYVIGNALNTIDSRRSIAVYKFMILVLMKYSYDITPYISYKDLDMILHIIDNYIDYNLDIYINSSYITNIVTNIYHKLTPNQITDLIMKHPYIYHIVQGMVANNPILSIYLDLVYFKNKYQLNTLKDISKVWDTSEYNDVITYYRYTSIREYNLYNNTSFDSWSDLRQYLNDNQVIDKVIESIDRRSPDLVYMLWKNTYDLSVIRSKVIDLFKSKYDISYRLVDVLLKILKTHFPFNEIIDIIIENGYDKPLLIPEVVELILRNTVDPSRLIPMIPIVIHNNMKRAYESINDVIKYSKGTVRTGYITPIVSTTYLHGGIMWLAILAYINDWSMWLDQYTISMFLRELKNRGELDITDDEIRAFESININTFAFTSNSVIYT